MINAIVTLSTQKEVTTICKATLCSADAAHNYFVGAVVKHLGGLAQTVIIVKNRESIQQTAGTVSCVIDGNTIDAWSVFEKIDRGWVYNGKSTVAIHVGTYSFAPEKPVIKSSQPELTCLDEIKSFDRTKLRHRE